MTMENEQVVQLQEQLARVEAERDGYAKVATESLAIRRQCAAEYEAAQAQLAEAVGLFWFIQGYLEEDRNVHVKARIRSFISRHRLDEHDQAGQQEGEYYCKVCRNHGCVSGCHPDYYKQQEAQGAHGDEAVLWEFLDTLREAMDRQALPGAHIRLVWDIGCEWINARAALATQPAAGEPVYQWREDESQRWWTTSKADYEWILGNRPSYQARILWTAPPAAAHGDEAVRKDAERLDFILTKARKVVVECISTGRFDVYVEEGVMGDVAYPGVRREFITGAGSTQELAFKREAIDAAMRAQGDGEVQ